MYTSERILSRDPILRMRDIPEGKSDLSEYLEVKGARLYREKRIGDYPDGVLTVAEFGDKDGQIPLPGGSVRRFKITNLGWEAQRGVHAHRTCWQYLTCESSFVLHLFDGKRRQKVLVDRGDIGVLIAPLVWLNMTDFADGCRVDVEANEHFNEAEYIRDYQEFLELVETSR